jgi:hypothetical protein
MQAYYDITKALKDQLENEITKTVTLGDISEVDLNRRSIFPLAHIICNSGTIGQRVLTLDFSVLFMDLVDYSEDNAKDNTEPFYGNNNLQDVHNTQLAAANLLAQSLLRGTLWGNYYQVTTEPTVEPFQDRFENSVAGWALSFSVEIHNTDISIC